MNLNDLLISKGILRNELKVGVVSTVTAQGIKVNLAHAGDVSGAYINGSRYGRGEVGELLLIEGQQSISLGRLTEVCLPDRDRSELTQEFDGTSQLDAIGFVQLLGSINIEHLKIQAGISAYPRLGDRVFSAPSEFISALPELMNGGLASEYVPRVVLELGEVTGETGSKIRVTPEKLFGRHCAILGSTGGGKSWTTAKIIEECSRYKNAKVVLIDATSEYRTLSNINTEHFHLGKPIHLNDESKEICIPPTDFIESDFMAMFDPAGKVQGPKLREAIKSLRLAKLAPNLFPEGFIRKIGQPKVNYRSAMNQNGNAKKVDDPSQPFDINILIKQIQEECCYPEDRYDKTKWGGDDGSVGFCSSLFTRILAVVHSESLQSVFKPKFGTPNFGKVFDDFLKGDRNVFRLCFSDVSYQFYAREVLVNVIGRQLLSLARKEIFRVKPILAIVDEAHNFLGKRIGAEDHSTKLDSFEIIAKEGRKYGLNICLATQRPRDITEGVLSQMGTLLVHRLTNDRDREVVERACGEIDRSAASFLPNLKQGEVAIVGVDFPIPMTVQMDKPKFPPKSDGPSFQKIWL